MYSTKEIILEMLESKLILFGKNNLNVNGHIFIPLNPIQLCQDLIFLIFST